MKNRIFEPELPEGYTEALAVDAADSKFALWMNLAALALTAVLVIPAFFIIRPMDGLDDASPACGLVFIGVMFVYIVLHELTHGIVYKVMTGRKLTFGLKATVAYCGVPDIYVYRKTALLSLLAPFTVYTVVFAAATLLIPTPLEKFMAAAALAVHVGGCAGDLYDTGLFLFRFRDPETLMRDTGPKQTFYLPRKN